MDSVLHKPPQPTLNFGCFACCCGSIRFKHREKERERERTHETQINTQKVVDGRCAMLRNETFVTLPKQSVTRKSTAGKQVIPYGGVR